MIEEYGNPDRIVRILFQRKDTLLFDDSRVMLIDDSCKALIENLHTAFARFQNAGFIREDIAQKLSDTSYEEDYHKTNARLSGKTWKTLDLQTAAFLIGFQGCLGQDETLALLPFDFEIILRADAWVCPFELVIASLRRKKDASALFHRAYEDIALRGLIHAALQATEAKYKNDARLQQTTGGTILKRAIADWAAACI